MTEIVSWLLAGVTLVSFLLLVREIFNILVRAARHIEAFKETLSALRDLHDEQNGPPLETRRKQWQAAMDRAIEVLQKHGA